MGWDEEKAEKMIEYAESWALGQSGNVATQFQQGRAGMWQPNFSRGAVAMWDPNFSRAEWQ